MAKVVVASAPAKRILAEHLAKTESPGITFMDVLSALGQVCGPAAAAEYEGPKQPQLRESLLEMRKEISNNAIRRMRLGNGKNA